MTCPGCCSRPSLGLSLLLQGCWASTAQGPAGLRRSDSLRLANPLLCSLLLVPHDKGLRARSASGRGSQTRPAGRQVREGRSRFSLGEPDLNPVGKLGAYCVDYPLLGPSFHSGRELGYVSTTSCQSQDAGQRQGVGSYTGV